MATARLLGVEDLEKLELLADVFSGYRYWGPPEKETDNRRRTGDERPIRAGQGNLAPCVAGCTSATYNERVRSVAAFLRGSDLAVLERLEQQMRTAADAHRFEQAAAFRDAWQDLQLLHNMLARLRDGRRDYNFIYPLPGYGRRPAWYLIRRAQVARVIRAPRMPRQAAKALEFEKAARFRDQEKELKKELNDLKQSWHDQKNEKQVTVDQKLICKVIADITGPFFEAAQRTLRELAGVIGVTLLQDLVRQFEGGVELFGVDIPAVFGLTPLTANGASWQGIVPAGTGLKSLCK